MKSLLVTPFVLIHVIVISLCTLSYHTIGSGATFVSPVFDLYILSCVVYISIKKKLTVKKTYLPHLVMLSVFISVYTLRYFYFNQYGYYDLYEFIRSIRFLIYIFCFVFILSMLKGEFKKNIPMLKNSQNFYFFLSGIFIIFYSFQIVVLGESRPRLFSENNYEIPSLLILYVVYSSLKNKSHFYSYLSSFATLLSLSKSGVLELFSIFISSQFRYFNIRKLIISLVIVVFGLGAVYFIFSLRSEGQNLTEMDRFLFLNEFFYVVKDFNFPQLLFGIGIAHELPISSCVKLQYWADKLFSDYHYCNATVFHSFIMKIVFEFGFIGTIYILSLWWVFLRKFFGKYLGFSIFMIVFICSISVTGFSNSIVIWPIYYMCLHVAYYNK